MLEGGDSGWLLQLDFDEDGEVVGGGFGDVALEGDFGGEVAYAVGFVQVQGFAVGVGADGIVVYLHGGGHEDVVDAAAGEAVGVETVEGTVGGVAVGRGFIGVGKHG